MNQIEVCHATTCVPRLWAYVNASLQLHPFCQQREIVEYCNKEGIIVQAYSPLVMGRLDHPVLQRLAKKWNKDAAQIAIRWSLQHG